MIFPEPIWKSQYRLDIRNLARFGPDFAGSTSIRICDCDAARHCSDLLSLSGVPDSLRDPRAGGRVLKEIIGVRGLNIRGLSNAYGGRNDFV